MNSTLQKIKIRVADYTLNNIHYTNMLIIQTEKELYWYTHFKQKSEQQLINYDVQGSTLGEFYVQGIVEDHPNKRRDTEVLLCNSDVPATVGYIRRKVAYQEFVPIPSKVQEQFENFTQSVNEAQLKCIRQGYYVLINQYGGWNLTKELPKFECCKEMDLEDYFNFEPQEVSLFIRNSYSFVMDSDGRIYHEPGVYQHSKICHKFDLKEDDVYKLSVDEYGQAFGIKYLNKSTVYDSVDEPFYVNSYMLDNIERFINYNMCNILKVWNNEV